MSPSGLVFFPIGGCRHCTPYECLMEQIGDKNVALEISTASFHWLFEWYSEQPWQQRPGIASPCGKVRQPRSCANSGRNSTKKWQRFCPVQDGPAAHEQQ